MTQKIKIGKATIGLIGLEQAMQKALAAKLSPFEARELLFKAVSAKNYVPPAAVDLYKKALGQEYQRRQSGDLKAVKQLTIRILGPGCVSCNKLNTMIFDIMQRRGLAADIEQIHDLDEIWRHGVIATPALIVNGIIKSSGRMPSPAEVEQWLLEEADTAAGG